LLQTAITGQTRSHAAFDTNKKPQVLRSELQNPSTGYRVRKRRVGFNEGQGWNATAARTDDRAARTGRQAGEQTGRQTAIVYLGRRTSNKRMWADNMDTTTPRTF